MGILGKVTETGHGLILALQNANSQNWNTINGWTSETTYAGTTLKVLPDAARGSNLTSYTTLGETARRSQRSEELKHAWLSTR